MLGGGSWETDKITSLETYSDLPCHITELYCEVERGELRELTAQTGLVVINSDVKTHTLTVYQELEKPHKH